MRKSKFYRRIEEELDRTRRPYRIETGKNHHKIIMAGRLIGVFSFGHGERKVARQENILATIRREAAAHVD